jgi:hypothetical protein
LYDCLEPIEPNVASGLARDSFVQVFNNKLELLPAELGQLKNLKGLYVRLLTARFDRDLTLIVRLFCSGLQQQPQVSARRTHPVAETATAVCTAFRKKAKECLIV